MDEVEAVQERVDKVTERLEQHLRRDHFREVFEQALRGKRL